MAVCSRVYTVHMFLGDMACLRLMLGCLFSIDVQLITTH